ncbi:MAG: hypothetical protein ACLQRM_14665 [Acidimicrobiales bacterium]
MRQRLCRDHLTAAVKSGIRESWERLVKKGRHRRFEEARSLKRAIEVTVEPCPECGADPEEEHASWCLYESEELDEPEEADYLGAPSPVVASDAEHNGALGRKDGGASEARPG